MVWKIRLLFSLISTFSYPLLLNPVAVHCLVHILSLGYRIIMCDASVSDTFSHVLNRNPTVVHLSHKRLKNRGPVKGIVLCRYQRVVGDGFLCQKLCITWNYISQLIM